MSTPLVSIAMATYNGADFLQKQLDSIYSQSYTNIEVIVSDDCSTDNTVEILKRYQHAYGLKYYTNSHQFGFVKNFEQAIKLCSGDFIALADQDDIWETNKIEVLLTEIKNNLLIHSDCSIIDSNDNILNPSWKKQTGYYFCAENLIFQNMVTGCTLLFQKDLLNTALPFPETIAYHDWWLAFCAASQNKISYTEHTLTRYRQHFNQNTGVNFNPKNTFLRSVFTNIINRFRDIPSNRKAIYLKHKQNLEAVLKHKSSQPYIHMINDAIRYFEDYCNNKIHVKTFYISLKYAKYVYPHKNHFFIKNILLDIIG